MIGCTNYSGPKAQTSAQRACSTPVLGSRSREAFSLLCDAVCVGATQHLTSCISGTQHTEVRPSESAITLPLHPMVCAVSLMSLRTAHFSQASATHACPGYSPVLSLHQPQMTERAQQGADPNVFRKPYLQSQVQRKKGSGGGAGHSPSHATLPCPSTATTWLCDLGDALTCPSLRCFQDSISIKRFYLSHGN